MAISNRPSRAWAGACWLGAWLDRAGLSHPDRTIRVHAGDMVGVSPLISSHLNDEPTIEATNLMGFDVGTLGNHEFDEGGAEALRLVRRARYLYIAANTVTREGGELILPPYSIVERSGVKIGFIGVTTEDTPPTSCCPSSRGSTAGSTSQSRSTAGWPSCGPRGSRPSWCSPMPAPSKTARGAAGEIVDETRQMDDAVDVVIAGHTHSELNLQVEGKLVVEALSHGMAFDWWRSPSTARAATWSPSRRWWWPPSRRHGA